MGSREELERELDEQIDGMQETIRDQFFLLGQRLYELNSESEIGIGKKFFEECVASEARFDEAKEKKADIEKFISEYEENDERLNSSTKRLDEVNKSVRNMKIRLGAIIYERASSSLVDRDKFKDAFSDVEKENGIRKKCESRNPIERLSAQNALLKMQKSANERYISYAERAIDESVLDLIGGSNAPEVVQELAKELDVKTKLDAEWSKYNEYEKSNRDEYTRYIKGGAESADQNLSDVANSLRESLISYGNYLFDKGNVWISETTPSDILDIIEKILALQNDYEKLNASKQRLEIDARRDDYRSMIKDEEGKILILEREKEKIDFEIEQIRMNIKKLNSMIDQLN